MLKFQSYKSYYIFLFILLVSNSKLTGQEKDFNLWTGVQIEKEMFSNLSIDLELNNRLKDNLNQRDESFLDFGINYSIKDLKLSLLYRFSNENEGISNYSYSNRFSYQRSYKYEIQRFRIDLRSRYQTKYKEWFSSENGFESANYLRNRVKLRYNISGLPIDPLISYEGFTKIDKNSPSLFRKQRVSMGLNYKINKKNTLGIVFHIQNEKNAPNPSEDYILSLSYSIEL